MKCTLFKKILTFEFQSAGFYRFNQMSLITIELENFLVRGNTQK